MSSANVLPSAPFEHQFRPPEDFQGVPTSLSLCLVFMYAGCIGDELFEVVQRNLSIRRIFPRSLLLFVFTWSHWKLRLIQFLNEMPSAPFSWWIDIDWHKLLNSQSKLLPIRDTRENAGISRVERNSFGRHFCCECFVSLERERERLGTRLGSHMMVWYYLSSNQDQLIYEPVT